MWWARDAYLFQLRQSVKASDTGGSSLRDDNLDLGDLTSGGRIWEIKTIRGAAFGVVQEFAYRSMFNLCVALLKDLPALHQWLRGNPRPVNFTCEQVQPGTRVEWPEISGKIMTASQSATEGGARTILVFTIDVLPGLVLYVRYDIPAWALALVAREIARDINKAASEFDVRALERSWPGPWLSPPSAWCSWWRSSW